MKRHLLGLALAASLISCAFAQTDNTANALRPVHKGQPPSTECNGNPCEISYNGGPVFEDAPTVYILYYGSWSSTDMSIINEYWSTLTGSTQEKINTRYGDSSGKHITGTLNFNPGTDTYQDLYSLGKTMNDSLLQEAIANAIKAGHFPSDANGIYFGLTYKDVNWSGMCTSYCGYHGPSTSIVTGKIIKYSFVGDPGQCVDNCSFAFEYGSKAFPNADPDADGTINVMWHEFSESSSDPEVNLKTAWAANACGESGDCCAWLSGTIKTDKNGNYYNELIKGHEYLTQMMLELDKKQLGTVISHCENVFEKKPH
ncbi:MAG TPA: hypothetical protein VN777_07720 [Terriglobales bacterium]|nr:hypothetical protein [Terriglobales bacterium]